jgi:hypothetical protein
VNDGCLQSVLHFGRDSSFVLTVNSNVCVPEFYSLVGRDVKKVTVSRCRVTVISIMYGKDTLSLAMHEPDSLLERRLTVRDSIRLGGEGKKLLGVEAANSKV